MHLVQSIIIFMIQSVRHYLSVSSTDVCHAEGFVASPIYMICSKSVLCPGITFFIFFRPLFEFSVNVWLAFGLNLFLCKSYLFD